MASILIIEDDPMGRELLRDILESAGHDVTEADNGEDGVKRYRPGDTDLVITDILMTAPERGHRDIPAEKENVLGGHSVDDRGRTPTRPNWRSSRNR